MNFFQVSKTIVILSIVIFLVACSNKGQHNSYTIYDENQNPLEIEGEETVMMGAVSHGFFNPNLDEDGEMLPLNYNGEELKVEYTVNASGKAKNIGFLIFVDGLPQPYKINNTEGSYKFMHTSDLDKDDKDTRLTFIFTPVTGKQGDTLSISITSIYNPTFYPDMKETSTYGSYHAALETRSSLFFTKDTSFVESSEIKTNQHLSLDHKQINKKI